MINIIRTLGLLLLLTSGQIAFAQTNEQKAEAKGMEAIKLMDNGKIEESIKLLKEAQKLDPERFDYPYEIAYALYLKEDYAGAIKILEDNKNHKDVTERLFQLLGNSYDILGKTEKAFEAYNDGLKLFPNSGIIYLEIGNVYWGQEKYGEALPYYEKGIEVDPTFPSNYYRATLIYCSTTEEIWGLIYGEIFMNLERNSKRTVEISKLLYDTYKDGIVFKGKNEMSVSFCQNMSIDINSMLDTSSFKMPFCMMVEPLFLMSLITEKEVDINSLDRIRTSFVNNYFANKYDAIYPNVLYSYQRKVIEAGHIEAYNHWILMQGDEAGFKKWEKANKDKWDSFVTWFTENGLMLDNQNKFYTGQY
jgi:tetratricopeptide (TPR) repeat protein